MPKEQSTTLSLPPELPPSMPPRSPLEFPPGTLAEARRSFSLTAQVPSELLLLPTLAWLPVACLRRLLSLSLTLLPTIVCPQQLLVLPMLSEMVPLLSKLPTRVILTGAQLALWAPDEDSPSLFLLRPVVKPHLPTLLTSFLLVTSARTSRTGEDPLSLDHPVQREHDRARVPSTRRALTMVPKPSVSRP